MYHHELRRAAGELLASTRSLALPRRGAESAFATGSYEREFEEAQVHHFAQQYWGGRIDDLRQALGRLRQLRPALEPILSAEGVPPDLIAVVLIESGVQPAAESPRGARGLWQFVATTARRYGLRVNPERDDRLDTQKATRAAARYLRDLYLRFGDWSLALAAYNAGEAAVQQAIDQAGRRDFATLGSQQLLPAETRDYVPAVLAAMELLGDSGPITPPAKTPGQGNQSPLLFAETVARN
ncbi:MAG: lytic transglycosylase domain-containing protein [Terriglobia bacterium]